MTVIRNATILPMTEKNLFFRGDISIKDGKIFQIGNIDEKGDEEIDGRFKMQEREGIGVGLRVSAVKTTKNRDDAMVKWSFEKETRRFRSSFWFCLPSIPSKGETGGAKPPRSAARTASARAPETASTAFQRAFHRYGVAVRGE